MISDIGNPPPTLPLHRRVYLVIQYHYNIGIGPVGRPNTYTILPFNYR